MRVVLLGPPGAGKGTQGRRLAARYQLTHIDAGHIVRTHVAEGTVVGQAARPYTDRRELLPDELAVAMIGKHLLDAVRVGGYVLDGFPRKLQAQQWLQDTGFSPQVVLALEVNDSELIRRLAGRARDDGDHGSRLAHRLRQYHDESESVFQRYAELALLRTVDATGPPDVVTTRIATVLRSVAVTQEP